MAIEKRDIAFPSGDSYCAAWLFLPDGASPSARVPGVALAHGLGAVKEMSWSSSVGTSPMRASRQCFSTTGISEPVAGSHGNGLPRMTRPRTTAVP